MFNNLIDIFINKSREKNINIGLFNATEQILNNYLDYDTIMNLYEIEKVLFNDKEHRKFILLEDELKNLECVCKIREPFAYVTERLSAEKICSAN